MDEASERIRRRLIEYLAASAAEHRDVASRFEALPVYSDMGGTLFITPSLQVLIMPSDEGVLREEPSPEWRLVAFVAAAERFPELKQLVPARPSGVSDCSVCDGTGRLLGARCGSCFGLGWPALQATRGTRAPEL